MLEFGLAKMTKFLLLFIVVLTSFFILPSSVMAEAPLCDLTKVDVYGFGEFPFVEASTTGGPNSLRCIPPQDTNVVREWFKQHFPSLPVPPDCPSATDNPCNDPSLNYCRSPRGLTVAQVCFKSGKTLENPDCDPGSQQLFITVASKAATCRLISSDPRFKSCCKTADIHVFGVPVTQGCEDKLNPGNGLFSLNPNLIQHCNEIYDSTILVEGTTCQYPNLFTYDKNLKMCVPHAITVLPGLWELKNTCDDGRKGVQTAIGCIPTATLEDAGKFAFTWVFGVAGGIIVFMGLLTGYRLMTSQGDPKILESVKENFTSIVTGLILMLFSLVLLKTVGANIIAIPGLF